MTIEQLAQEFDKIIPPSLSEPWDNDGRMVIPNPNANVKRVLCALDCTSYTIELAKKRGCNVILTHHPLIFKPLKSLDPSDTVAKRVIECVKNDIAVLSYHTRLDIVEGGVNDMLSALLGLKNTESFIPYGRVGEVEEQSFEDFAKKVSQNLNTESLSLVKATNTVKRVAVVSGSGKDEIKEVLASGADTFVTGEVMHNHMIECKELGLNLICATHYATERFITRRFSDILASLGVERDIYDFVKEAEYGI